MPPTTPPAAAIVAVPASAAPGPLSMPLRGRARISSAGTGRNGEPTIRASSTTAPLTLRSWLNMLFIRRFLSGSFILVENILPRKRPFHTPTTAQQRTATHENSNSAQIDLVPSDNAVLAGGVKIDYVQPVATDSKVDSYEAESSDNTLPGTAKVDGSAVSWVGAGEGNTLQFNKVNASEDGDYTLTFAYAQNEVADNNNFQTKSRWG